ncbi:MAG: trypsin-like peptidase domain-containing protein [Bacteroidales bacterium]|nr:trypsin-like peptidase domain-containing protein [Bacteroidales bacterium]
MQSIDNQIEQCIFLIFSGGEIVGQGFIADGYFITAAHVLTTFPICLVNINSETINLSNEKPVYFEGNNSNDSEKLDVAIFRFGDISSSLHISKYIPQKGEKLVNCCMHEVIDTTSLNPQCKITMVPAFPLREVEGNYFYCNCERYGGSSGSPLLKNNEVVGIMYGGNDNGLCAFLMAKVIRKWIRFNPQSNISEDVKQ